MKTTKLCKGCNKNSNILHPLTGLCHECYAKLRKKIAKMEVK